MLIRRKIAVDVEFEANAPEPNRSFLRDAEGSAEIQIPLRADRRVRQICSDSRRDRFQSDAGAGGQRFKQHVAGTHRHAIATRCRMKSRLDERFACLVSTAFGDVKPVDLANWLLESRLFHVRMQLQMHKYIWEPSTRGV